MLPLNPSLPRRVNNIISSSRRLEQEDWYEENLDSSIIGKTYRIDYDPTGDARIRYSEENACEFDVDTFHFEPIGDPFLPPFDDPQNPFDPYSIKGFKPKGIKSKNAYRCRLPNCNPHDPERAYCERACYAPVGQCAFLEGQRCRSRQFTLRRLEICKHVGMCCVCPHISTNLQITYNHDRLSFLSPEAFRVRNDDFSFILKCCPIFEYLRICRDEIEIKNKMKQLGPQHPQYKVLKNRFHRDANGVWAYKSAPECTLGDRPDNIDPDFDQETNEVLLRDINIPSDNEFRQFVMSALYNKDTHACPPQVNFDDEPPWSPKSWVFKSLGYKPVQNGGQGAFLCYRMALFSIPYRDYNRKTWFGNYMTAEQYFCLNRTQPRYKLWKISDELDEPNRKRKMDLSGEPIDCLIDPRITSTDDFFPNECTNECRNREYQKKIERKKEEKLIKAGLKQTPVSSKLKHLPRLIIQPKALDS